MLAGMKRDSENLFISTELGLPDTGLAQTREVSLPLDTLNRQVFVVTDIMAYVVDSAGQGQAVANQDIDASWSVSSVDLDAILATGATGNIGNPRVLAAGGFKKSIGAGAVEQLYREWGTDNSTTGTPSDYLGIIATPDYYIRGQYLCANGVASADLYVRVVGYMAIASADTYAALVTQEVNNR